MSTGPVAAVKAPTRGESLAVFVIALAASLPLTLHFGHLGFHFEDLSIPFDGGFRVALGQEPFVDFVAPIGPVLFLQQGLVFKLFGVSLEVFLLHAAVLGALSTWMVWGWMRRSDPWLAGVAAGVTLAWFYLPVSAPYIDTTAFFWVLVALAVAFPAGFETAPGSAPPWRLVLAGCCAGLAILTKQNIGVLGTAGLALLLVIHHWRLRAGVLFGVGATLPVALLMAYVASRGGWSAFVEYFWHVPLDSGRLKYIMPWAGRMVIKLWRPELINSDMSFMMGKAIRELMAYGIVLWMGWRWLRNHSLGDRTGQRLACVLAAFLLLLQQWSFNTSNNDEVLYWPFLGLVLASICRGLWGDSSAERASLRRFMAAAGVLTMAVGIGLAASRVAHSQFPERLTHRMEHPRLEGLRLTPQEGHDLEALLTFIDRSVGPHDGLFVLGHTTLIYGASGLEPPQPLLWFRAGVSYAESDSASTDLMIVKSLEDHKVEWIVLDPVGADELLEDFPGVARLLEERFRPHVDLGGYRVHRRLGAHG